MSVLIRGMEIPKSCRECACYKHKSDPGYYDYDLCGALKATFNETKFDIDPFRDRLENCPLVEVPTPHGRLIDADVFDRHMKRTPRYFSMCCDLEEQTTIIEAEKGEEA